MHSYQQSRFLHLASSTVALVLLASCGLPNPINLAQGGPAETPTPVPTLQAAPPLNGPALTSPSSPGVQSPQVGVGPLGAAPGAPVPASVRNPAAHVYARNGPSVVNITGLALTRTFFGRTEQPRGTGSGFVIDNRGHIVTNSHVVEEANQLTVTFHDRTTVQAELLGRDPDNDLAVIRVDPDARDENGKAIRDLLRPVALGDSDRITIGEDAIAIGSPLGLQQTVTAGIVSAIRSPGEETGGGQIDLLGGAVQTDASINPGNSGGPLFNANGEVIGVNTAILSQSGGNIGIGFAIPVNVVRRVVPELIQFGCYRHPLIGVTTISLSVFGQSAKAQLGLPTNQKGLLVQETSAGAERAGLRAGEQVVVVGGEQIRIGGDVIVAIDGHAVTSGGDLRAYIENQKRPGETVMLTLLRNGERQNIEVRLTERPNEACR